MPFNVGPVETVMVFAAVAIYVGIPLLLILAIVRFLGRRDAPSRAADPRKVLADRLVRGEISQAEFETALRALGLFESRD